MVVGVFFVRVWARRGDSGHCIEKLAFQDLILSLIRGWRCGSAEYVLSDRAAYRRQKFVCTVRVFITLIKPRVLVWFWRTFSCTVQWFCARKNISFWSTNSWQFHSSKK